MHGLFISSYPGTRTGPLADYFQPQAAILPIRTAILRLDPSSACFTSNHELFLRLCLEAREYRVALPILDRDIFYFPSPPNIALVHINPPFPCSPHEFSSTFITTASHLSAKLDHTHHLQYFIFGAMIYMKLKDWERALHFLEIVITCPAANTASMIQVEAYKKWILVHIVANGQVSHETYALTTHL
jgi:COP9 signalosome complex subunit 3